ncbi:hypothetical protein E4U55_005670 [Claviceps digitariae]|nr:hypothetical protein E4U55_005670 [Claviceps digitariae]
MTNACWTNPETFPLTTPNALLVSHHQHNHQTIPHSVSQMSSSTRTRTGSRKQAPMHHSPDPSQPPESPFPPPHDEAPSPSSKRKEVPAHKTSGPATPSRKRKAGGPAPQNASPRQEKRMRRYRSSAPKAFHDVYERALSQRFYVLQRTRGGTEDCPEEKCEVAGSTGNIYTVEISQTPKCTCPHALKDNHCKHIIYILARVLQAPYHHVYQRALLSSELREIFANAPVVDDAKSAEASTASNRKSIEGDCPICFCPFDAQSPESIVWCRAACGQNIHQECFEMWARTKTGSVTCPFCRSTWQGDPEMVSKVEKSRGTVREGYLNVADQLGISTERDRGQ